MHRCRCSFEGAWPYYARAAGLRGARRRARRDAPRPLPPVRIFLGTEEGQYRAERVFVWSVLQVRDPARVYEIHLMKNVAGFDRRGWRTGFTCYRFAIPDFAGRTGKAIYNDVDQIYLADPALLFDLPLGRPRLPRDRRPRHLGDADRLRADAALVEPGRGLRPRRQGPADQQARPRCRACGASSTGTGTPATSNMSRAGPSACTTRPCTSSPGTRSPRPIPTTRTRWPISGTISSAAADAAGFEVFTRDAPEPRLSRRAGLEPARGRRPCAGRSCRAAAGGLLRQTGAAQRCWSPASAARSSGALGAPTSRSTRHDFARAQRPAARRAVRRRAGRRHLRAHPRRGRELGAARTVRRGRPRAGAAHRAPRAEEGVGSEGWWRRRVEAIAAQLSRR